MLQRFMTGVVRNLALPYYAKRFQSFARLLDRSRQVQRELLLHWVRRCRDTQFGRDHGFVQIRDLNDFRRQVPVARYDQFEPYINAVARGDLNALFPPEERVERFTITTGSTGTPKLNPVTPTWLRAYRASWDLWGSKMLVDNPTQVGGKIMQIIGSWNMGQTPNGTPISMVSALLARNQSRLVRPFYAIPNDVTDIPEAVSRYYATMRLGVAESIGLIVLMNPGSLIRLARLGDEHRESLIRDIHDGTLSSAFEIPDSVRNKLAPRLKSDPRRAHELERIVEHTGRMYPKDYWRDPIIACWLGGTAGYQSRYLPEYFGNSPLRDQGLVSSEGRHTIPLVNGKPEGVLSIQTGFYEFLPVNESNSSQPTVLEGHELEIDCDYHLLLTTFSGYFRFHIGDVVRCRGFVGEAPVLEFLQKSDRCGDLEGEKVTEHQFLDAATGAATELGLHPSYMTAVPLRPTDCSPCYTVMVEHSDIADWQTACRFLDGIDQRLKKSNFLYSARRREGVLGAPRLMRIPQGAWGTYIQAESDERGTGDVHYKHPGLVADSNWIRRFEEIDTVQLPES